MTKTNIQVKLYVKNRLNNFASRSKEGGTKAALANLRRGVGRKPGDMPEIWGYFLEDLPEKLQGQGEPSYAEWAIYAVLTLFALHQQGHSLETEFMSQEKQSFGKAMRLLVQNLEGDIESREERVRTRLNRIAISKDMDELTTHMRGIVKLLGSHGIALDYPDLAEDFYWFQFPERQSGIRLKWGQDFYFSQEEKED